MRHGGWQPETIAALLKIFAKGVGVVLLAREVYEEVAIQGEPLLCSLRRHKSVAWRGGEVRHAPLTLACSLWLECGEQPRCPVSFRDIHSSVGAAASYTNSGSHK